MKAFISLMSRVNWYAIYSSPPPYLVHDWCSMLPLLLPALLSYLILMNVAPSPSHAVSFAQDPKGLSIENADDWLEEYDAGPMGRGARFKKSGRDVLLTMHGERRECTDDEVKAWCDEKPGERYGIACCISPDALDQGVIVYDGDDHRYCLTSKVWDECDQDQCRKEGTLILTTGRPSLQPTSPHPTRPVV